MKQIIERAREILCSTPDSVCLERARLVTDAYKRFENEPVVIRRANAFRHVLANMTLDLDTNPIFAGNTSSRPRAWMLLPEYGLAKEGQLAVEHPWLAGFLDGDAVPADLREFWSTRSAGGSAGVGHLAVNLSRVVREGLEAILDEINRCEDEGGSAQHDFRRAAAISCQAVIDWANRYAQAARQASETAASPAVRKALLRVAQACAQVPAKPARNLFEALQAMALIHLAIHIEGHGISVSIGLPDRVLAPYAEDTAEAAELIAAFMLKIAANSVWGSFSKTQAITVGGLDERGRDQCNAVTRGFLDALELARMPDPHLFLRWHSKMDKGVRERAIELLSDGMSMPMLIGDEQTVRGFVRAGIAERDAWSYCVIGCNELGIPGKLAESAMGPKFNHLEILNKTLLSLQSPDSIQNMDQLVRPLEKKMEEHLFAIMKGGRRWRAALAEKVPTPFTSALMDGCIERGCDMHAAMEYNLPGLYERGFTNAVNGLSAIDHLVFKRRTIRLSELIEAMRNNFADKAVRTQLLGAPKWGNDDDRADQWALALLRMRERAKCDLEKRLGQPYHLSCHVVRSLHYIDGKVIIASPDGRLAYTPVADSIGAQTGTAVRGPTALLRSVQKLEPATYWRGGYNLNLTFSKITGFDHDFRKNLFALAETFFANGGQEMQINCLDAGALREAQRHPEKYGDLLVRVAGFNARFVYLSPAEQEEIIARAEKV